MVRSIRRNSKAATGNVNSKKRKLNHGLASNPSVAIFMEHGFHFAETNTEPNELSVDQVIFQQRIRNNVKCKKYSTEQLLNGLEDIWNDSYRFCFSILPTASNADCINSSRGQQQDSLTRLLLGIKPLQEAVGNLLLEKLAEVSVNEELLETASKIGDFDLIKQIVSQFKWLDNIVGDTSLLSKLFEILTICETKIQEELISCIPDLVDDDNHSQVATQLKELLLNNTMLVPCILETLSNMNLKGELLDQIRETVKTILSSANLKDLPGVVKFLQQSINEQNGVEIIDEIREKINFSTSVLPQESSTPNVNVLSKIRATKEEEALIFEAIKSGIRFQKSLADHWTKVLEGLESSKDLKIIDVYVLLSLHDIKSRQKSMETLIRNKIKGLVLCENIIVTSFESQPQVFSEFMTEILLLGETLLRSNEISFSKFGCTIYKQAFINFDCNCQQKVVSSLVTHVGSGYGPEIEASFQVLQTLVDCQPIKMSAFIKYLKGILDYVNNLSVSQMRSLFSMISILMMNENHQDDGEMFTVIQKQLASTTMKYKRIGIIGSMMLIANMSKRQGETAFQLASSQVAVSTTLPESLYKQVIKLLTMVQSSVKQQPEASALFFDELANIVHNETLDEKILNWISERVVADFQDEFLVDIEVATSNLSKQLQLSHDLDSQSEGGICVNILPLILLQHNNQESLSSSSTGCKHVDKLICLPAQFRLVRVCESKQHGGDLEGIDALLGCPLVLFKQDAVNTFASMKTEHQHIVCLSLLHAANWIRETLNAFSGPKIDTDIQKKLVSRVKTLHEINKLLSKCLAACSNFVMPVVDHSIDDHLLSDIKSLKDIVDQVQFKKPKPRKAKKKAVTSPDKELTDVTNLTHRNDKDDDESDITEIKVASEHSIDLQKFPASFRQLDLEVFYILTYCQDEVNSENDVGLKLSNEDINMLLGDLERKLEFTFNWNIKRSFLKQSANKLIGFSHLPNDVTCVKYLHQLLPSLLQLFDDCQQFYESLHRENDGMIDCDAYRSEANKSQCLMAYHLLKIFYLFLSWEGFKSVLHKETLLKTLNIITTRKSSKSKHVALSSLASAATERYSATIIPNIRASVTQLKLLLTLQKWCEQNEKNTSKIVGFVKDCLQRQWFDLQGEREKGATYHEHVSFLIRVYLDLSSNPLSLIDEFCEGGIQEIISSNLRSDEGTADYSTLTRNSLPSYYKVFYEKLIGYLKRETSGASKLNSNEVEMIAECLSKAHTSIKIFQKLNNVTKEIENRNLFAACLKYSRLFFDAFLKLAMPLLDKTLRSHKDAVHGILKSTQQSTRGLQHLCAHSKFAKDLSLTTHVPGLKKCLETFVFRVKAMLAYNHCDSAFWLGNLKNRDLKGNEILTQDSTIASSTDQDDNESEAASIVDETEEDMDGEECSESF